MKRTKFLSVASLATLCLILSGILYTSCSNDEDSWDEEMQTLAESKMTRAGENVNPPVYCGVDTSFTQCISAILDAQIIIQSHEGFINVVNPSVFISFTYYCYGAKANVTSKSAYVHDEKIYVEYTVKYWNPEYRQNFTYNGSACVALKKK